MTHTHMKELVAELNAAAQSYYNTDTPIMSDALYDQKLRQLMQLEAMTGTVLSNSPTVKVGAPVLDNVPKITITGRPMLSLKKVYTIEEIEDFAFGKELVSMIKVDGLSVRLIYENGELISANTRGDGYVGSDITQHIKYFTNVPLSIQKKERYVIDGEAIIYTHHFAEINKDGQFKNPRNTAAGTLNLLDMAEVKRRKLSFIAWDVIDGDDADMLIDRLENADALGFTVVPYFTKVDNAYVMQFAADAGIPCDGVVWKFNDVAYGRAQEGTSHHFGDGVAWKPGVESAQSKLIDIEWSMGRTGVLTPVAIFEPVELDGTTVERASIHNPSIMEELLGHPYKGQEVEIIKANLIIPQIQSSIKASYLTNTNGLEWIDIPEVCPICGNATLITDDSVVCTSAACPGKLVNIIDHYCGKRGLDIKGLSKATIEKLIDWGWLNAIEDIYELYTHRDEWIKKPGFGVKSVDNILAAIAAASPCDLDKFIAGLGIPLVGSTAAKTLSNYFAGSWSAFREATLSNYAFELLDDFGAATAQALLHFNYASADIIANRYIAFNESKLEENKTDLDGLTFVITGSLKNFKNRDELKGIITSLGGKVSSSVSSKTSYLINNDVASTSAKNREAQSLGVKIISEDDFCENFLNL